MTLYNWLIVAAIGAAIGSYVGLVSTVIQNSCMLKRILEILEQKEEESDE